MEAFKYASESKFWSSKEIGHVLLTFFGFCLCCYFFMSRLARNVLACRFVKDVCS